MKRRTVLWIVAAVVLALLAAGVLRVLAQRKAQRLPPPVVTESVVELAPTDVVIARTRVLAGNLPVSGSLRAVNSAVVKARVAGELLDLTVREGDPVRAGQVVARVEATESRARLAQAQQQADSAQAQVRIAQRQFDNNRALVEQGFISRTALDTSQSSLAASEATWRAATAAADVARKALDDTVLRSPLNGQVSQRLAQPGERVAVEARVLEVVDLSRLELEAALPPADSLAVRVGQRAELRIDGLSAPLAARVARISPVAQAGSRGVLVYLEVERAEGLRQGLFAQGAIETGRTEALAVPLSAVRTDKPLPYVQVIDNGRVAHRQVTAGQRGVDGADILLAVSGLAEGTEVVAGNVGLLREGVAVRRTGVPAAPSSAASAAPAAR